jgi:C4-dicarboxylate transporter DctQ subunit
LKEVTWLPRTKERVTRFIARYNKIPWGLNAAANLSVLVMCALVFVNVILRYVFAMPFHWTEEITSHMLVFLAFLAAAEILRRRQHIKLDILFNRFPVKMQRLVDTLISIVGLVFCGTLTWQVAKVLPIMGNQRLPTLLGLPLILPYSYIFLGAMFLTIQFLIRLIEGRLK